ncbi:MAG TPA: site-2 protease family protein [Holophagaceae bacterium]|nr:site-2 protease family protein [Holophagaceae bacterium]
MFELLAFALPPKVVNLAYALLGIGALIFLHELGHFLAAKYMGMPVETFSIGFGKRLVGFKWKETDVRLSVLPLGGYVKLAGFNPEDPGADDPHGFLQQPYWKRMLFYSGGIIANLIVAFVLFAWVGQREARVSKSVDRVVADVQPGAAKDAGLLPGDELLAVGPFAVTAQDLLEGDRWSKEIVPYIQARAGQVLMIRFARQGQARELAITPANVGGVGRIGLAPRLLREVVERRALRFSDLGIGATYSVQRLSDLSGLVFGFLKKVVTFKASSGEVGGPITITRQMSQFASMGLDPFFMICAAISLQLAILNALPIPMLDGGHMLLLTIERLRRRDFSLEFKEKVLTGGFVLLASLMGLVLVMDLFKLRK